MKFRGKMIDIGCIQQFYKIVSTIAKIVKSCTMRLTLNKLYFILTESVANGGVRVWCEIEQGHFFDEYAMEGVHKETANEIYLELAPDNLSRAMKATIQLAKSVKIKLTKKNTPCLTIEIELPSLSSNSRTVVHDVPVSVVPRRLWGDFQEPEMPSFDVSIYMPPLKVLRNVIDRMKNLSNFVLISANYNGEMVFRVDTDMVSVATHFRHLSHPTWSNDTADSIHDNSQQSKTAEARVDIRKFAQFMSGEQVNPTRVICNIVNQRVIHCFLLHDDVSLQYFLPAVSQ